MASFTLNHEIAAPPETVFEVLTDHRRYSELTPLRKSVLEREGETDPNGVGAIRKLTAVGPPMREEVIAYEAPSRFSYTVLSGLPVRDHVGTVELTPSGGGTKIAKLETGLEIRVPLFIKQGEKVKIATETREFSGRA